ncbi:hypothetical protein PL8927_590012 [Planktothrix serta PCC 8927]|uniref:Uncharacterized protein n=1 Tax=Planktothrix serta PCC 8927 TaxID=671068 RepID=A0A7Z9E0W0_9CYAN|nr:hypothetical protein PL8927_590012 [Planktothrix serta PCC 8927]
MLVKVYLIKIKKGMSVSLAISIIGVYNNGVDIQFIGRVWL